MEHERQRLAIALGQQVHGVAGFYLSDCLACQRCRRWSAVLLLCGDDAFDIGDARVRLGALSTLALRNLFAAALECHTH